MVTIFEGINKSFLYLTLSTITESIRQSVPDRTVSPTISDADSYLFAFMNINYKLYFISEMKISISVYFLMTVTVWTISSKTIFEKIKRRQQFSKNMAFLKSNTHKNNLLKSGPGSVILSKSLALRKEVCKTKKFKQIIRYPGCFNIELTNRLCYGRCYSFYIPGGTGFSTCGQCRPDKFKFVRVKLFCPGKSYKVIRKKVLIVKTCHCVSHSI